MADVLGDPNEFPPDTTELKATGLIDDLDSISWDEAMHQLRTIYGLMTPAQVRTHLHTEGWGYHKASGKYVFYGKYYQ